MRITSVNNCNTKTNNKPAFGTIGKINVADMTSLENEVVAKNLKELDKVAKGVYADIKLGICDQGRYFDVMVSDLAGNGKGEKFTANPRTVFTENSPEESIKQALFNNFNRAKEACLKATGM